MFDLVARLPLAPLLAVQALAVRKQAQCLPEPPGPRAGEIGDGPPLRLLVLGDSSAAGVGAPDQALALTGRLPAALAPAFRVSWQVIARTGLTTKGALDWWGSHALPRADVAVVALGVNDVTRLVPRRVWIARRSRLNALIRDRTGARLIVASGVPPMHRFPLLPQPLSWILGAEARRLDLALAGMDDPGHRHLPLDFPFSPDYVAPDGFHPSPAAYALWAEALAASIRLNLPEAPNE